MYRYDIIHEELQDRVDCGMLALEDAEILDDLAYERYVIEKKLTDEEKAEKAERKEGRKRKAKLAAKIAAGIAAGIATLALIKKLQAKQNSGRNNSTAIQRISKNEALGLYYNGRSSGEDLKAWQADIKTCIQSLERIKGQDTITQEQYDETKRLLETIFVMQRKVYLMDDKNYLSPEERDKRKIMLAKKYHRYNKKYLHPIHDKYGSSRFKK